MDPTTPRDLVGYGANPPDAKWPGGAQLALSIVLNYEEVPNIPYCTVTHTRKLSIPNTTTPKRCMGFAAPSWSRSTSMAAGSDSGGS